MNKLFIISFLLLLELNEIAQEKEPSLSNDSINEKVSVTYHSNGKVESNGHYIQNKKSGEWNYWNENGDLIKLEQFKNGLHHGVYIEYYPRRQTAQRYKLCQYPSFRICYLLQHYNSTL